MSNSVKMIVGIAAAVVMPFAAPAIAAAISAGAAGTMMAAGAAAIGSTATSALVGAGLGAVSSAVTGGDVGRGALFGALGGGLGSVAKTAQAAQAANAAAAANGAAGVTPGAAGYGVLSATPEAAAAAAPAAGGVESGFNTANYIAGLNTAGTVAPGAGVMQAGTTGANLAAAKPGLAESMKAGLKGAWTNATSPENVSNFATQGAKYAVGAAAAGDGMNSAQEAMLREQRQMARSATQANEAMFNTRRDEALKLVNEANYFDPEYMGLQRARDAQLRGARSKTAGLRGLDAGSRVAEGRRFDLNTNRNTGTAYDSGYQTGVQARTQTRVAGLSQLPTSYQTNQSDYQAVGTAYDEADKRRRAMAQDIGNLFGDFSGAKNAQSGG